MKKLFILLGSLCSLAAFAGLTAPMQVTKIGSRELTTTNEVVPAAQIASQRLPRFASDDAPFRANFTVEGADAGLVPMVTYNFDSGFDGWTVDPTTHVEWSTKPKNFSEIDPTDVMSLFVEGDYRVFNREISGAVSPKVSIPDNGVLDLYVYYSLNMDGYCRLELSLSGDGFEQENIVLWNSGSETGQRTAYWHPVTVDLADFAGREVQFRLLYTWGADDEIFKTGGYMGDFAIDGFTISGRQSVEHIDVVTGEEIHLMDITEGEIVSRLWTMPGATPSTSSEKNPVIFYTEDGDYDISLTVSDAEGNTDTKTMSQFVSVTGTAPVARIIPPATFRLTSNRLPLVAPLVPVAFKDGSTGFPTSHKWTFSGVSDDPDRAYTSEDADPEVGFAYLHDQKASLTSANSHGESTDELDFTVEYGGTISNLRPTDLAATFDMDDWGVFPGSNTRKITAYAERFSKPSRPLMVTGAYVFFNRAQAGDIVDQISNVGVHLCTSKDGKPDRKIDSWWWSVYELDTQNSAGDIVGTAFPFTYTPFVDDEFFIVVDGIPAYKEASGNDGQTLVSFLMAPFRAEGNTALMLKDGDWIEASDYFPAGANHTSFYIYPQVYHSVMAPLTNDTGEIVVGAKAAEVEFEIFSYLGRTDTPEIDGDWLRVVSAPGEYTVDNLKIAIDALPDGTTERTGHIRLTDGASELLLTVTQNSTSAVAAIELPALNLLKQGDMVEITGLDEHNKLQAYSLTGLLMAETEATAAGCAAIDIAAWPQGVYVIVVGNKTAKLIKN